LSAVSDIVFQYCKTLLPIDFTLRFFTSFLKGKLAKVEEKIVKTLHFFLPRRISVVKVVSFFFFKHAHDYKRLGHKMNN